jgi:colicin import membrane protein
MEIIVGKITEYNEFRNQVSDMVKINAATVFDYESDKGEKEARSYVYKLRQSKSAIEKKRKELGEDLVARKKMIDGEAKELIITVDGMIDVHMKPLEEKAEREAERKAKIDSAFRDINDLLHATVDVGSEQIEKRIAIGTAFDMSIFQERREEAENALSAIMKTLYERKNIALQQEQEAAERERQRIEQEAEIARLRDAEAERQRKDAEEQAERDRIANKERLQREADERARKAADEAAQAKIREAESAQRKAEEEAARVKRDAEAAEAKRIADAKAQADADAKRAADIEHRKKINNAILVSIMETGITEQQGKDIIKLIASGLVANLKITY